MRVKSSKMTHYCTNDTSMTHTDVLGNFVHGLPRAAFRKHRAGDFSSRVGGPTDMAEVLSKGTGESIRKNFHRGLLSRCKFMLELNPRVPMFVNSLFETRKTIPASVVGMVNQIKSGYGSNSKMNGTRWGSIFLAVNYDFGQR